LKRVRGLRVFCIGELPEATAVPACRFAWNHNRSDERVNSFKVTKQRDHLGLMSEAGEASE